MLELGTRFHDNRREGGIPAPTWATSPAFSFSSETGPSMPFFEDFWLPGCVFRLGLQRFFVVVVVFLLINHACFQNYAALPGPLIDLTAPTHCILAWVLNNSIETHGAERWPSRNCDRQLWLSNFGDKALRVTKQQHQTCLTLDRTTVRAWGHVECRDQRPFAAVQLSHNTI